EEAIVTGGADAVLVASLVHHGRYRIAQLKAHLARCGIPVREVREP
ncbi:MAG: imidazole glycerol phosphate synthase subunit HisF, partial [candidate division GAL15 bacterium]